MSRGIKAIASELQYLEKFPLGGTQVFKYNAAYLVSKNSINCEGVRGNTLRMQLEKEFSLFLKPSLVSRPASQGFFLAESLSVEIVASE